MKRLSEETIAKFEPQSRRKARLYRALVGLYNSLADADDKLKTIEMGAIEETLEDFQSGGHLPVVSFNEFTGGFAEIVKHRTPTSDRKIRLYRYVARYALEGALDVLSCPDNLEAVPDEYLAAVAELKRVIGIEEERRREKEAEKAKKATATLTVAITNTDEAERLRQVFEANKAGLGISSVSLDISWE